MGCLTCIFQLGKKLSWMILIDRNEEVTIKELSEKIDVSPRTIHRDLNTIEKLLRAYNLELVRKTGVGIQIVGSETDKEILKQKLNLSRFVSIRWTKGKQ